MTRTTPKKPARRARASPERCCKGDGIRSAHGQARDATRTPDARHVQIALYTYTQLSHAPLNGRTPPLYRGVSYKESEDVFVVMRSRARRLSEPSLCTLLSGRLALTPSRPFGTPTPDCLSARKPSGIDLRPTSRCN